MSNKFTPSAVILHNDRFINIQTLSGYNLYYKDDERHDVYLPLSSTVAERGEALLTALAKSRMIINDKHSDFYDSDRIIQSRRKWLETMKKQGGYKTQKQAMLSYLYSDVNINNGKIIMNPSISYKTGESEWLNPDEIQNVVINFTKDPIIVGNAVNLVMSRCIDEAVQK